MAPRAIPLRSYLLSDEPASRRQARLGRMYRQWLGFRRNPLSLVGMAVICALLATAVLAPHIATQDPLFQSLEARLLPPSAAHWLGTDALGRDVFSRLVYGSRVTFAIVALVVATVGPVGLLVGTVAGYAGGWIDRVLMRLTDIFLSLPRLVLALSLVAALGPGLVNAVVAIAVTAWPPYARMARAETMVVRGRDYVTAARLLGAPHWRIIWRHVMPVCLPSLIVRTTLDMAGIILTAAGLGFLGLGAQPPLPEWGVMIADGREQVFDQWWIAAVPGLAIMVVALAFNLVGDGMRDGMDAP